MLTQVLAENAPVYFLVFTRIFLFLSIAPLLSSQAVPVLARLVLAGSVALVIIQSMSPYPIPDTGLGYVLLLMGEGLLGIIGGFFVVILLSVFQLAGQYLSLPMGFSASQVLDPLAQVEIPLVGQFFNLLAMSVFLSTEGIRRLFFIALKNSFESLRAVDIAGITEDIAFFMVKGLASLFVQSLIISLPIMSILFLVMISLGLVAKSAPQMNVLILGFPISIGVSYIIILLLMPALMMAFSAVIDWTLHNLGFFFEQLGVRP